jgi:peptidoglycan/xylan/chitin deacetylase (PgdA/CDA1 family)
LRRRAAPGVLHIACAVAFTLAAGSAVVGSRLFVHKSNLTPALITPQMNLHLEVSDDILARFYRVMHEMPQDRSGRPKLIALTFDDGPYPVYTPLLLDVLQDLRVPATFFLIGRDAQTWPDLARRIEANGNEVSDHTYSHPNLDAEPDATVRNEILEGRDVLWALTHDPGVRTLMRPSSRTLGMPATGS